MSARIAFFNPTSGSFGTIVTVSGNFVTDDKFYFSGALAVRTGSYTNSKVYIIAPASGTTGHIWVTGSNGYAVSSGTFYYNDR